MISLRRWVRKNSRGLGIVIFVATLILNNIFDFPRLWGKFLWVWLFQCC